MPFKKKQTSRLNSLNESFCNCSAKSSCKHDFHFEREQFEDEIFSSDTQAGEEIECETLEIELNISLTRTSLLIKENLEFKAARSIQRFVRGWLYRSLYKRKRRSAIRIQTAWRHFYCQRLYFKKLEAELQQRIERHFYRAAQKIQAYWRGWWVRHHVHDLTHLKRVQLLAGEDLLYCVAFKLHHLLRTHQIPGVYSLRNSNALSKVEQLLASLRFKAFNHQSIQTMKQHCRERRNAEKQHKKSTFGTKIPFPKNDINSLTKQKCSTLYSAKDADTRMAKIMQIYEEENRRISNSQISRKKFASRNQPLIKSVPSESSSFCGDIVESMKKWKIISEKNLKVDSNIFKKPENVENFLKEMDSKLSLLEQNRNCGSEFLNDPYKAQTIYSYNNARIRSRTMTNKRLSSPLTCNGVQALVEIPSACSIISSVVFNVDEENMALLADDTKKSVKFSVCSEDVI